MLAPALKLAKPYNAIFHRLGVPLVSRFVGRSDILLKKCQAHKAALPITNPIAATVEGTPNWPVTQPKKVMPPIAEPIAPNV